MKALSFLMTLFAIMASLFTLTKTASTEIARTENATAYNNAFNR